MGKVYFYHYTSKEAAESIKKSRVIRKTVKMPGGGDANFGEGTYGTPLGPELGRQALAKNNYGYAWSGMEDQGRVDVAILIVFKDDGKIRHVRHEGREIYIYAEDVYLDNAEEVEKVDFKYL